MSASPFHSSWTTRISAEQLLALGKLQAAPGTVVKIQREMHEAPENTRIAVTLDLHDRSVTVIVNADGSLGAVDTKVAAS